MTINRSVPCKKTEYGFRFGAAEVSRLMSDGKQGWVVFGIETPRQTIQVYVTRTGKVRIYDDNGEWTKPKSK